MSEKGDPEIKAVMKILKGVTSVTVPGTILPHEKLKTLFDNVKIVHVDMTRAYFNPTVDDMLEVLHSVENCVDVKLSIISVVGRSTLTTHTFEFPKNMNSFSLEITERFPKNPKLTRVIEKVLRNVKYLHNLSIVSPSDLDISKLSEIKTKIKNINFQMHNIVNKMSLPLSLHKITAKSVVEMEAETISSIMQNVTKQVTLYSTVFNRGKITEILSKENELSKKYEQDRKNLFK